MKNIVLSFILYLCVFYPLPVAAADSVPDVTLSPNPIVQGGVGVVRIIGGGTERKPDVKWMGRKIPLIPKPGKKEWYGFIGADLGTDPGKYGLLVNAGQHGPNRHIRVGIVKKDYGVRRLTLPKKMVDLDAKTLERVKGESRLMKELWRASALGPLWQGAFLVPVPGEVIGPFGRRSVINNQPRSPHSGVDLRGKLGTPVKSTNRGRVVLTADHFFSGRSVVIDHGGGIQSMYFHLDSIVVKEDDEVLKGQVIGHIGSTGRATGPHLHWGMRVNGARIDPMALTALSRRLEE